VLPALQAGNPATGKVTPFPENLLQVPRLWEYYGGAQVAISVTTTASARRPMSQNPPESSGLHRRHRLYKDGPKKVGLWAMRCPGSTQVCRCLPCRSTADRRIRGLVTRLRDLPEAELARLALNFIENRMVHWLAPRDAGRFQPHEIPKTTTARGGIVIEADDGRP
jgi:hypothetical protein